MECSEKEEGIMGCKGFSTGGLEEQVSQPPASQHPQQRYCADQVNNYCVSEHANQGRGGTVGGGGIISTTKQNNTLRLCPPLPINDYVVYSYIRNTSTR